jgi:hypothetical protein
MAGPKPSRDYYAKNPFSDEVPLVESLAHPFICAPAYAQMIVKSNPGAAEAFRDLKKNCRTWKLPAGCGSKEVIQTIILAGWRPIDELIPFKHKKNWPTDNKDARKERRDFQKTCDDFLVRVASAPTWLVDPPGREEITRVVSHWRSVASGRRADLLDMIVEKKKARKRIPRAPHRPLQTDAYAKAIFFLCRYFASRTGTPHYNRTATILRSIGCFYLHEDMTSARKAVKQTVVRYAKRIRTPQAALAFHRATYQKVLPTVERGT